MTTSPPATMHPAEDWAETFAHYLRIRDTLTTAAPQLGLMVNFTPTKQSYAAAGDFARQRWPFGQFHLTRAGA